MDVRRFSLALGILLFAALTHADSAGLDGYEDYALYYSYDYFDDSEVLFEEEKHPTCILGSDGNMTFKGTQPCDIRLSNADSFLTLSGGIDGVYSIVSCENGRPAYKRLNSPLNEERSLWFSAVFRDWDLGNGTVPSTSDIIVFGGLRQDKQPEEVQTGWNVATEFLKEKDPSVNEDYTKFNLTVTCEQVSEPGPHTGLTSNQNFGSGTVPLLSDRQMEAQYQEIYSKASVKD